MDVAVIGAGGVGSTLGRAWAMAGHRVHYGVRDPAGAPRPALKDHAASVGSIADAIANAQVVLLATPFRAVETVLTSIGDFGGRVLLDATNPIGPGMTLLYGHDDSGAEQVQRWAPSARVVKVFNSTGRENMAAPVVQGHASMMLACGDDVDAVEVALGLARDVGFDALPFGPLERARLLEPLALVWIRLAMGGAAGRRMAFGVLRRDA